MDIALAYLVVLGGIAWCECGEPHTSRIVNTIDWFLRKPIGVLLILFTLLSILFYKAYDSDYVIFSNDGPLGSVVNNVSAVPWDVSAVWDNSQYVGSSAPAHVVSLSWGFRVLCFYPFIPIGMVLFCLVFLCVMLWSGYCVTTSIRYLFATVAIINILIIILIFVAALGFNVYIGDYTPLGFLTALACGVVCGSFPLLLVLFLFIYD